MSLSRREFLELLAVASASGLALSGRAALAASPNAAQSLYEVPQFGNVSFLHFTDCHAQLLPLYFREPDANIGVAAAAGKPPHLTGENLLRYAGIPAGSREAYAFTCLDFTEAAHTYGKVGGFAHLATLIRQLKASRPHALLLDGGDTWQGSATALWTNGQDMIDAAKLLGVDIMTAHWEFTLGARRVKQVVDHDLKGRVEFLAQNVSTNDFGDPVFQGWTMREMNGVPVAIIGQAFPYTPIAHPRALVPDWTFGIQETGLQNAVRDARAKGAQAVILLSHNGMDVDLKLASRVTGIDVILGGHTHDAVPVPVVVGNASGQTLVTNAGCTGKYLAVLDLDVRGGKVQDFRYKLLPVFANLLAADSTMQRHIENVRAPWLPKLEEKLAVADALLYRRGNFNGSWDQLILDALMEVKGAEIAFSPGFRWGTSLLPGQTITREELMNQIAITYPTSTLTEMTGATLKTVLEDVCDNLFNPDPYYQQGGDMVRVGGLQYTCTPNAKMGSRITNMRLNGKPIAADKTYKVAGWAPVQDVPPGPPIWDVVETWLTSHPVIRPPKLNLPELVGVANNAGLS